MKNANCVILLLIMLFMVFSLPGSNLPLGAEYNFHDALAYAFSADIDTLILTTSGGIYTTPEVTSSDSNYFVIYEPLVIIAQEGLAERPIFTHPNGGEDEAQEIFRVLDDIEFNGVAFMGGIAETNGCKYAVRYGDYEDDDSGQITRGKTGTVLKFYDCHFEGFHSLKDQDAQGNAIWYLRPVDDNLALDHLRNTQVYIENCTFKDIGDEAIRISENEKYGGTNGVVACDTLVVRNCTFDDIDAECIRIYGDLDTSRAGATFYDGAIIVDHVTVVNSAPRFIYAKNYRKATVTNILVAYGREPGLLRPDRGDYTMQVQLSESTISHVDTFQMVYTLPYANGRINATKGADVDESTIYGYDPMFVDHTNGDYTLAEGSPMYVLGSDKQAIGDLRWATNPPPVSTDLENLPEEFSLIQNYPNPFNPETNIEFYLDASAHTTLRIFNLLGNLVAEPVNGYQESGHQKIEFDGASLPSGIYFYELRSGNDTSIKKMLLVK